MEKVVGMREKKVLILTIITLILFAGKVQAEDFSVGSGNGNVAYGESAANLGFTPVAQSIAQAGDPSADSAQEKGVKISYIGSEPVQETQDTDSVTSERQSVGPITQENVYDNAFNLRAAVI